MREIAKGPASGQRSLHLPPCGRLLLLSVSFFLFLVLNAVGAAAQTADDHGNTFGSATPLSLGSSLSGRIDPGNDVDVFKLDLSGRSGTTDVWIYTTGELDTKGGLYHVDSDSPFLWNEDSFISGRRYNFHLRATLGPGIYYVGVFSYDRATTGNYILHAEAVTDPGNTVGTAKTLNLSAPTAGSLDFTRDRDYFRLDLATSHASVSLRKERTRRVESLGIRSMSETGSFLQTPIFGRDGFTVRDHFGPGTHYIRVFTLFSVDVPPCALHHPRLRGRQLSRTFLEDCQAKTDAL